MEESLVTANRACRLLCMLVKAILALLGVWWLASSCLMIAAFLGFNVVKVSQAITVESFILYVLGGIAMAVVFVMLIRLFSDASEGRSPFTMAQVKRLRVIATALAGYSIVEFMMTFSSPLVAGKMEASTPTLNLFPIVAAAVVFAFSFVFKYGVLLQEFSDDTL